LEEFVADTSIEWTDRTWNIASGCTKISEGCSNCYIERTLPLRMARRRFDAAGIGGNIPLILHPERVTQPLSWRQPQRVFVNSLTDLFHRDIPVELIAKVFAVMALTPQHTYQILTKRPGRMLSILGYSKADRAHGYTRGVSFRSLVQYETLALGREVRLVGVDPPNDMWPLPHVHLGVSAENQKWADVRISLLCRVMAASRFVSAEPLLAPILLGDRHGGCSHHDHGRDLAGERACSGWARPDWLIIGGESGPGARAMELSWASDLVSQARDLGITPFVKQLGTVWARNTRTLRPVDAGRDPKGSDWTMWPENLQVREFPTDRTAVPA
jgi:protein gp37